MSRCFPFPPPGYEKKPITDEIDLLKKEKRKEKKHKKDKKEKDKKEREKDRSEGKHKDKKEKKDKHRDKKKDKEKSRTNTPDNKSYGQFEGYNGEKVHHNGEQIKEKSNSTDDKRLSIPYPDQNGDLVRNRFKVEDVENSKLVQELRRRIRDEESRMGSHQSVVDGRKNSFNRTDIEKMDGRQPVMDSRQPVMDVAGFGRNVVVPNRINGATPPPFDNKIDRRVEQREKMQEKGSDDKRGDKRKNKDRDKHGKEKSMEKEKKEKVKEKSEQKKIERDKKKHFKNSEAVSSPNNLSRHLLDNRLQGASNEGNLRKRKDMETNGVLHENELRPNKMARPTSNIPPENGRKLDFLQNPGSSVLLDKQGASQGLSLSSFNVGSKDGLGGQRVSDMIASQPGSVSAKKPLVSAFNHITSKPAPIHSPPVITNHVAFQSSPARATKTQPNHIAVQSSPARATKTQPNHIVAQSSPARSTKPQPYHIAAQSSPARSTKSESYHIAAQSSPARSTKSQSNHIAAQSSPARSTKSQPNHIAAQSSPARSIKSQPNHIAAQLSTSKPLPSIPNPIANHHQLPPLSSPPPPTTTTKQPIFQSKPPPSVVNNLAVPPPLPISKKKPPHPDTKYLEQVLSVPKLDPWCAFDDQEWLYNSKTGQPVSEKPTTEELQVQVWSEAKHIESVDVCALPYVIPY